MKKDIEVGDLVQLTGCKWYNYDKRLEDKLVLIIAIDEFGDPIFIDDDGDKESVEYDKEFGATIVQKAIK